MYQIKMTLLMASEYKEKKNNCPLQVLYLTMQNEGGKTITYKANISRNLEKKKRKCFAGITEYFLSNQKTLLQHSKNSI